jgi:NodT family efflux transporter outer membrane factor (OMF) lipoprotein
MLAAFGAAAAACVLTGALTGCTVGPEFKRPDPPSVHAYTAQPLPPATVETQVAAGASQRFVLGQKVEQQWWTLFHSDPLNQLIEAALHDNPGVAAAQATLRQARETLAAERGVEWPAVTAQGGASRQRESSAELAGAPFAETFNLFNASVGVSYAFDLFGGVRRQLESLQAQVDDQQYQLEATYLTLTSNLAAAAIRAASLRAQLQATHDIEALEVKQVDVTERRFSLGAVSRSDVLSQRTLLAQTHATVPPLERQLAFAEDQLAIYAGRFPAEGTMPQFDLDGLQLPVDLPVSVPSELVHQRPDILAAEALLHSASAEIGVATANQYPNLTLSGQVGLESFRARDLFKSGSFGWSLGGELVAPLFNGGQLAARKRAAIAAYDAAVANYKQTVLAAFGNVADSLRALDADARALEAQVDAQNQARAELDLAQKQFGAGALSQLQLLTAQQQFQQTRIAVVQLQADRYADTVALFIALGGGWWNRDAPAAAANP